jgi:hypothetical protein
MRTRAIAAFVLLLAPAALTAQLPLPGSRGPGPAQPVPLGKQPTAIRNELAVKRSRLSVEAYPIVNVMNSGLAYYGQSTWASVGTGTHADYRVTRRVAATADITSSFLGGPAVTNTFELGARLHPEQKESKLYPYLDLRIGYLASYNRRETPYFDGSYGQNPAPRGEGARYSTGFGGLFGTGAEYLLTRRWSLMAGAAVMRHQMTAHAFQSGLGSDANYGLTTFRFTLGLRFNPAKLAKPPATIRN